MNEESLLIHQPTRLKIMAALCTLEAGAKVDFAFLGDELGLTGGNLGFHLQRLEEAGMVGIEKVFVDRKPKTWVEPTAWGREAFARYVRELERIVRDEA